MSETERCAKLIDVTSRFADLIEELRDLTPASNVDVELSYVFLHRDIKRMKKAGNYVGVRWAADSIANTLQEIALAGN